MADSTKGKRLTFFSFFLSLSFCLTPAFVRSFGRPVRVYVIVDVAVPAPAAVLLLRCFCYGRDKKK